MAYLLAYLRMDCFSYFHNYIDASSQLHLIDNYSLLPPSYMQLCKQRVMSSQRRRLCLPCIVGIYVAGRLVITYSELLM